MAHLKALFCSTTWMDGPRGWIWNPDGAGTGRYTIGPSVPQGREGLRHLAAGQSGTHTAAY